MDVTKSLLAISISSALLAGLWAPVNAKTSDEEDSVYRWGRWAVLAPAAGNEEVVAFAPAGGNDLGRCETAANCPSPNPKPEPEPPAKSPCEAGMPCGFARIDHAYDPSEQTRPDESHVVPFQLMLDEEGGRVAYSVDPDSATPINSGSVPALILPGVVFTFPGGSSDLTGPITRNGAGDPAEVQGLWANTTYNNDESQTVNGGEFVWGITATADQMQSLIGSLGGDMTAVYEGMTMGTTNGNEGAVRMEVNFNSATWTGQFNGDVAFTASGDVVGSGFVSNAGGFSNNIVSGDVKGGFVNAGQNAIGGYEVMDNEGIKAADVFSTTLQSQVAD